MSLNHARVLTAIKLLHTAVWAFFVLCILLLPVFGLANRLDWALAVTILIVVECAILALNKCRCPLTNLAARYTRDRRENFDIYLPRRSARHNKTIFGTLFIAGELLILWRWLA
ncbi:MAG: hypothetical protein M3O35_14655 [Acidobacteriota bacterium]|nr:hypothetical protein [Acidobacteriota bacterium]